MRRERLQKWTQHVLKLIRFLAAGLPSFLLAVPLNWMLVERVCMWKPLSYAIVLAVQITINFFLCRRFVFEQESTKPIWVQFQAFFAGIAVFRLADWLVYAVLVNIFGFYYLAVQIANIVIFAVAKFEYSRRVMET